MKKLLVLAMSLMMVFAMSVSAFATEHPTYDTSPATTPVHIIIAATGLDFTVTEKIDISVEADKVVPTSISDYTIKNNNASSYMKVDSLAVTNGTWTQEAYSDENTFLAYNIDAKKFALKVKSLSSTEGTGSEAGLSEDTPDLNTTWNTVGKIWYGDTMTITFDGFVTPVSEALSGDEAAIANIVATVSIGE